MALETMSATQAALGQRIAPKLIRLWNRSAVLATMIAATPGKGPNAAFDVESGNTTEPDTVAEGADLGAGEMQSDIDDAAKLGWSDYRAGFNITQRALDVAASSGGITATDLVDLFELRIMSRAAHLVSKINKDLYAGTGTSVGSGQANIVGLFGGATDASGTYAGLARGTYADWAGNVLANGGTPRALSLALLAQAERNVFTACGETPTHIMCSPGTYSKYESFFTAVLRVSGDNGVGGATYSAGASQITNYLETQILPPAGKTKDAVLSEMRMLTGRAEGAPFTTTELPFRVEVLGKTGTAYKVMLYNTIQLVVKKPNAFAQITDIDET
jgi:hypothetical protein